MSNSKAPLCGQCNHPRDRHWINPEWTCERPCSDHVGRSPADGPCNCTGFVQQEWSECLCEEIDPVDRPCTVCAVRFKYVFDHAAREVQHWKDKAVEAQRAMVGIDQMMEQGLIVANVPLLVRTLPVPVVFIPVPIFPAVNRIYVVNQHGEEAAFEDSRLGLQPGPIDSTSWGNSIEVLLNRFERYTGPSTLGLVALVHPVLMGRIVRHLAGKMLEPERTKFLQNAPKETQ